MKIPYPRPTSLSDPYRDFSDDRLRDLLAKPDDRLQGSDFTDLFGPALPAGVYEEVVYFLPLAMDYLMRHPNDACELQVERAVFGFIHLQADRLERDGLLEEARQRILQCLRAWTCSFTVTHLDEAACRAKGWGKSIVYRDFVERCESLHDAMGCLNRYDSLTDLLDAFLVELTQSEEPVACAWLLALMNSEYEYDSFQPLRRPIYARLFGDLAFVRSRWAIVQAANGLGVTSPTYWRDVQERLCLA